MSPKPGNQPLVYDENLLAQAPEVTQGQRQEGYDADILNPSPPPVSRTPAPNQPYRDHPDVESGSSAHDKHLVAGGYDQPTKKPFWKTPKGIIILVVLGMAVIAAVVGGAVGGTVGKNKNKTSDNASDGAAGGSGGNSISSTTVPTHITTAQTPSETSGGGDTPGGGGSNQSTSTRRDGASPTQAASVSQSLTTTPTVTTPGVEPPTQPGAGDGAGTVN
ncbi:hypothetical protein RSOLAG22IIIB_04688 [Rhizoctonia solani]|uniref:Uncharacterized protein n=1 Tax=Rhizoctonia solani TaxID=456999 RepID=A0A0K6FZN4_9AGAM|nr:hypothetical protein RSOLAG22IIIB_04688 [Rhizoctonia solani]